MFYSDQFETFDPIADYVSDYPLPLSKIAERARWLLGEGVKERMVSAVKRIDSEIEDYFNHAKELKIYQLETDLCPGDEEYERYFEWDGGTRANGHWFFKEHMANELGIPSDENTGTVDALKAVIEERDSNFFLPPGAPEPEPKEFPEGKDYELFAVLSLCLVADASSFARKEGKHDLSIASSCALEAMNAVCYAEHLRGADWLLSYAKKRSDTKLTEALREQKTDHQKWVRHCLDEQKKRLIEKNAEMLQKHDSKRAVNAVSHRTDQQQKAGWKAHCKMAKERGVNIATLEDLTNISGYDPLALKIAPRTLKTWAREEGIEFKPGRPKK